MVFDWTINVGHILTIFGLLIAGMGFHIRLTEKMKFLSGKVIDVETKLDKFSDVLVAIARQEERLNAHDHRMNDLQRSANEWRAWAKPQIETIIKKVNGDPLA